MSDPELEHVRVTVNGSIFQRAVEPRMHLGDFLRHELKLTGTHIGCEHGVCGTCTVIVNDAPVRSCLMFAGQANGARSPLWKVSLERTGDCILFRRPSETGTRCSAASVRRAC